MKLTQIDRRMLLLGGTAMAVIAACSPAAEKAAVAPSSDPTLVTTAQGQLRGKQIDGVYEFLGVRYAQAPVGPLRFQAPKKMEAWQGEVSATEYGQPAVQMRTPGSAGAATYPPVVQAARAEAFASPENTKPAGDEDCLVLNVYCQKTGAEAGATRPVMVWIHGGGFAYGQAGTKIYRGHNLAKNHDVVFVGVNHRLNVFGFLGLDSAGVPGFTGSANAGQLDIIAALQWVKENIAQFGGDPNNVTIFGQSGGGAKVSTLLAMPPANGLFHKAIIQSGAGLRSATKEQAAKTAKDLLAKLKLTPETAAAELQKVPVETILAAATEIGGGSFRPSVDDLNLPRHPFDPDAPAQSANIPIMIGFTKDERTLYNVGNEAWFKTTDKDVLAAAERTVKGHGKQLAAAFKAEYPDYDPKYQLMQVTGTYGSLSSHHTLASRKAAQPAGVYAYVFAHDIPPQDFVLKAPHTSEIAYVMDNVAEAPLFAGATPDDIAMGKLMSATWVQFAKTGNPNGAAGLPEWPKFASDARPTMFFQKETKVVDKPFEAVWQIAQANPNANASPI
ncbi:MAG TPA: carboxylesterase family protein [Hyphomonadaceae bacterium]|jgi:para-nitrobenzyl esterase|nr:carboxylesterase family protein [Hyphomonadaceae bacterium]